MITWAGGRFAKNGLSAGRERRRRSFENPRALVKLRPHYQQSIAPMEARAIGARIAPTLGAVASRYEDAKYPPEVYRGLKEGFGHPSRLQAADVRLALLWKFGHIGKSRIPSHHERLAAELADGWTAIAAALPLAPEDVLAHLQVRIGVKTRYITVAFLTHLMFPHLVPIMVVGPRGRRQHGGNIGAVGRRSPSHHLQLTERGGSGSFGLRSRAALSSSIAGRSLAGQATPLDRRRSMPSRARLPEGFGFHRVILSALLLPAACGGGNAVAPGDSHGSKRIELSVSSLSMWIGERDTVQAHILDATGNGRTPPTIRWDSDDPAIAVVDSFGVVSGIAEGRTRVTAASEGLSASVPVEVLGVALLELKGPSTLLVHESAVLEVTARDRGGEVIRNPPRATFSSSDSSLLAVSGGASVSGLRRGSASISVRVANATAAIALNVTARLKLNPSYPVVGMNVGDALRLSAIYADVNGDEIAERPAVAWRSNNPAVVTVTSDGLVSATAAALARIFAATAEDTAVTDVSVNDFRPGQPTSIRYAHGMKGMGPITFVPDNGAPTTVSYGESVDQPVVPGPLVIRIQGMPGSGQEEELRVEIRDGDNLALYAVTTGPSSGFIATAWRRTQNIPGEWGQVRLVQGSSFSTYYLRPRGEPATGLPNDCYFDPGNIGGANGGYGTLAPGDYDVILTTKYGLHFPGTPVEIARRPFEVLSGRAVTMVLVGDSADDATVLTFIDP